MKVEADELSSFLNKLTSNLNSKPIHRFRFNTNAFMNSARAVTLVLQKDYKTLEPSFDNWYQEKIKSLDSSQNSKLFLNLRNINQKEGNRLPIFVSEHEDIDKTRFQFQWDYSETGEKRMHGMGIHFGTKHDFGVHIPHGTPNKEIEEKLAKVLPKAMKEAYEKFNFSTSKLVNFSILINDEKTEVLIHEFIDMCNDHYSVLDRIVKDAIEYFNEKI